MNDLKEFILEAEASLDSLPLIVRDAYAAGFREGAWQQTKYTLQWSDKTPERRLDEIIKEGLTREVA